MNYEPFVYIGVVIFFTVVFLVDRKMKSKEKEMLVEEKEMFESLYKLTVELKNLRDEDKPKENPEE